VVIFASYLGKSGSAIGAPYRKPTAFLMGHAVSLCFFSFRVLFRKTKHFWLCFVACVCFRLSVVFV
jgi:hypothetical protein